MVFKLNEEQMNSILTDYETNVGLVDRVQSILNRLDIITDEEDYFEIVQNIVSQHFSVQLDMASALTIDEKKYKYMSLLSITALELERFYSDRSVSYETKQKLEMNGIIETEEPEDEDENESDLKEKNKVYKIHKI